MASRYLCAALLLLGTLAGTNYAKPPDLPQDVIDDCEEQSPLHRAGNIIIIGNHDVEQNVILQQVPFQPGQELSKEDLRQAVENLKNLGVFENDPEGTGIVPRVEILDPQGPVAFKDILITVQEKCCAVAEDDGKPKCSCETDCKCCGCKKCKDGEADTKCQCAAGECKCCGCKTAAALQIESKVEYGCARTACTASSCQVVQASCTQQTGCTAKRVNPCCYEVVVADGEKNCKCEKDCKCCGCKDCKESDKKTSCKCKDGECKCCGCKDKSVSAGCTSGKYTMTFTIKQSENCCPGCSDACNVAWMVMCEMFPPVKLATACPKMAVKVHKLVKPAFAMFSVKKAGCCEECGECCEECEGCAAAKKVCEVKGCCVKKDVAKKSCCEECEGCPAEKVCNVKKDCASGCCDKECCGDECECCEAKKVCGVKKDSAKCECSDKGCCEKGECSEKGCCAKGECAAKKSCAAGCCAAKKETAKKGCTGGCGDAKSVKSWQVRVCPWTGVSVTQVWKKGEKWEKLAVKPSEVEAVGVMPKSDASVCPYVKEQEKGQITLEWKELGSPLENLAKLQKARKLSQKAENAWNKGDYDRAIHCYQVISELVPGSQHDVDAQAAMQLAKAMKTVEGMLIDLAKQAEEKASEEAEPLPCKAEEKDAKDLADFTEKFTALLKEAACLAAKGEHAQAQEVAMQAATLPRPGSSRVSELMDAAKRSFAAGCHDDALSYAQAALMVDPNCCEASTMQDEILIMRGLQERGCPTYGCEGYPFAPGCDEEPCEERYEPCDPCDAFPCPGMGFHHPLPDIDPAVVRAMEKVVADLNAVVETCDDSDIRLLIDGEEEEDLELYKDGCRDFPAEAIQFKAQLKQMFDMLRQHVCCEVDMGSFQGVRLQVTMQTASGEYGVRIDEGQPVCCWHIIASPTTPDVKAVQQAHYEEVQRWIDAMNSGGHYWNGDDGEEAEEPLFQLETDLDPCW